jgi:hypothetical protein
MAEKKKPEIVRLCNRCNAVKDSNSLCQACGCPEFRIDAK